jgi:hypothetical protein
LILMLTNEKGKPNLKIFNQILDFIYETNDLEMHWERIKAKLENDIRIKLMN